MGFQGDVAGIGLGELLQGLARGGREGVLTLHATGLGATLGLAGGQLHLLPEADENPELWRKRCERAWVKDPNQRIDSLRMGEIAFAARMEGMFRLLDSEGVHFRFEPGPLPIPGQSGKEPAAEAPLGRAETGTRVQMRMPVLCHPISVEYLLLEYARLTDECRSHGDASQLPVHTVPRLLVPDSPTSDLERFWTECDGVSSAVEIADRLGWPLRQCKATLVELSVKGYLRFADARELLVMAQKEIGQNRFARAGSRLAGWCLASPPGPPATGDVELLLQEWARGKLAVVLASMETPAARTLLRRIELVDWDVKSSIERWAEMRKHHRSDVLSELHLLQWQLRSEDEGDAPQMNDLLRLARNFQDSGWPLRAGVILRACARRLPESTNVRLEVGTRLIAVGQLEEGSHWVLEASRTLIEAGQADRALGSLRVLLEAAPAHREARQLLSLARTKSASGRKARRNVVLAAAVVGVLVLGAFVKVRMDRAYDQRLDEIAAGLADPEAALALLEAEFGDDDSDRVANLRHGLIGKIEARKQATRNEWLGEFNAVQNECSSGDEVECFKGTLELREAPFTDERDSLPSPADLFDVLAARLEQDYARFPPIDLDVIRPDTPELSEEEARLLDVVERLVAVAAERERTFTLDAFLRRLESIESRVQGRAQRRAKEIVRRREAARLEEQDRLLAAARTHAQAGDIERAVENYRKLFATEGADRIREVFGKEAQQAEVHLAAVMKAEQLADQGDHVAAMKTLSKECPAPREHALPWRVESYPPNVRVILGDGSTRQTPFRMSTRLGERVELNFEHPGHEGQRVLIEGPRDVRARLSKLPDAWWRSSARVGALPVATGKGHVVANRAGELALIDADAQPLWETKLDSLGGVARTPVFLPERPEALLVLTEEGVAWLLEVEDGRIEGPWSMDSPPVAGPTPSTSGVLATFSDGRTALWTRRLKPQVRGPDDEPFQAEPQSHEANGYDAGLSVLRRSARSGTRLTPPWGEWSVEVDEDRYEVRHASEPERSFFVRLQGEWVFVAWEAPDGRNPDGTLWISDDEGLRAFRPLRTP